MRNIKFSIPTNSELSLKINYNNYEYVLDTRHPVELSTEGDSIEFYLIHSPTKKSIFLLILGILLSPIFSVLSMSFPTFYDDLSPLLIRGKYIFTPTSLQNEIMLKLQESKYDGKNLIKPSLSTNFGELDIIEESYEINYSAIKCNMLFCICNIGILVCLGLISLFLFIFSVNNLAAKIATFVLLIPLLLVSLISNVISTMKKKADLYKELSKLKDVNL